MVDEQKLTRTARVKPIAFGAVLWLGIGLVVVVALRTLGVVNYPGENWTLLLCAFFLVFVSRVDELSSFTLGPLKAELREKIREAAATIKQLRGIASPLSAALLAEVALSRFPFTSAPARKQIELAERAFVALAELGHAGPL